MVKLTRLDDLKLVELDIMKKIHTFCVDNDIKYFLAYGSLIGAVRHQGFIPWDDDLDLWMFRKDYEKFVDKFPEYGKDQNLYIATLNTRPRLLRNMLKVCDARTSLIEKEFAYEDKLGVFIDIWPLDGTPKNQLFRKIFCEFMRGLNFLFNIGIVKDESFSGNLGKRLVRKAVLFVRPERILKLQIYLGKKYKCDRSSIVNSYAVKPGNFPRECFDEQILLDFENNQFFAPKGYDIVLKHHYGDYMILPPVEQQVPHHLSDIFVEEARLKELGIQ